MKIIVPAPRVGHEYRKRWTKIVHEVDVLAAGGFAFVGGDFIPRSISHIEADLGTALLAYGEEGSKKHARPIAELWAVRATGLTKLRTWGPLSWNWAKEIQSEVAGLLAAEEGRPQPTSSALEVLRLYRELSEADRADVRSAITGE